MNGSALNLVAVYLWPSKFQQTLPHHVHLASSAFLHTSFDSHNASKVQRSISTTPAWARPPFHVGYWGSNTKIFEGTTSSLTPWRARHSRVFDTAGLLALPHGSHAKCRWLGRTLHAIYPQVQIFLSSFSPTHIYVPPRPSLDR